MAIIECPVVSKQRVSMALVYDTTQGGPTATRVGGPGEEATITVRANRLVQNYAPSDYELAPYADQPGTMTVSLKISQPLGPLGGIAAVKQLKETTGSWGTNGLGVEATDITWNSQELTVRVRNNSWPTEVYAVVDTVTMDVYLLSRQCGPVQAPPPAPSPGFTISGAAEPTSAVPGLDTVRFTIVVRSAERRTVNAVLDIRGPSNTVIQTLGLGTRVFDWQEAFLYTAIWVVPSNAATGSYSGTVKLLDESGGITFMEQRVTNFGVVQANYATSQATANPMSIAPGETTTWTIQIRNLLTQSWSGAITATLHAADDTQVGSWSFSAAFAGNETKSFTATWTAPSTAANTYTLRVRITVNNVLVHDNPRAGIVTVLSAAPPGPGPGPVGVDANRGFRIRWTRRLVPSDVQYVALGVPVDITLERLGFANRRMLLVGLRRRVSVSDHGATEDEHEYWLAPWPDHESSGDVRWARVAGSPIQPDDARVNGPGRIVAG